MTTEAQLELSELGAHYMQMFDEMPPMGLGITEKYTIELLTRALETGEPIDHPHDFLPAGAVA